MGEAFYGFPNRFQIYGSNSTRPLWMQVSGLTSQNYGEGYVFPNTERVFEDNDLYHQSTYHPNRALSAYYGYRLATEYVNRKGGKYFCMEGPLYTNELKPNGSNVYDIGTTDNKYHSVYASNFHGIADSALKLSHPVTLNVTGAVLGKAAMNGNENTITISTTVNHNHDTRYLKLTGGTMSGNIVLGGLNTGIYNSNNEQILGWVADRNGTINVGRDQFITGRKGSVNIYAYDSFCIELGANSYDGRMHINSGTSHMQFKFSNDKFLMTPNGNTGLSIDNTNGKIFCRVQETRGWHDYEVYHAGNLDIDSLTDSIPPHNHDSRYLKLTGGLVTGQIKKIAISSAWYNGRDNAMICQHTHTGYNPILSSKSDNGSWEFGPYTNNNMFLNYVTDVDYNNKNNHTTASYIFGPDGTFSAKHFNVSDGGTFTIRCNNNNSGFQMVDSAGYMGLKIWVQDSPDGNNIPRRYTHFSSAGCYGTNARCFAHFDRYLGVFESRVPFSAANGISSILLPNDNPFRQTNNVGEFSWTMYPGVKVGTEGKYFIPTESGIASLGTTSRRWTDIYLVRGGGVHTSDRNLKENIKEISNKFVRFFAKLKPVTFQYIDSDEIGIGHDRQHAGFIAQDVEQALTDSGLTNMDFGGICIDEYYPDKLNPLYGLSQEEIVEYMEEHPDEYINISSKYLDEPDTSKEKIKRYGLRDSEFIPLIAYVVQKFMAKVDQLEVMAGIKDVLEYPELLDTHRYDQYSKK